MRRHRLLGKSTTGKWGVTEFIILVLKGFATRLTKLMIGKIMSLEESTGVQGSGGEMRHDHPRGQPSTSHNHWCLACIASGQTTAEEALYEPPTSRGTIRPGMTVTWMQHFSYADGRQDEDIQLIGQVWSRAEIRFSPDRNSWYVVRSDQTCWKVNQNDLEVLRQTAAHV